MPVAAPRLTVSILTRNAESRLERLFAEVSAFADEVVVGVDASSSDRTLDLATAHADVVYQFEHGPQLSPARLLPLRYATGDWILSIDDDESIEPAFDALIPELLQDGRPTHYWFPRKWIASLDPCEYVHAAPWFPDWQLRLFRNDRSLVWKPNRPHTGYHVLGPGYFESRAAILHFEPVICDEATRRDKVERYRRAGGLESGQGVFGPIPNGSRRPAALRPPSSARPRSQPCTVQPGIHAADAAALAPWRAEVMAVTMPSTCRPGDRLIAEVSARNIGGLAWTPPDGLWPNLQLGAHVLHENAAVPAVDAARAPMPRFVAPGDSVTFLCSFDAPRASGRYIVRWDLVSEGECWFADRGGIVRSVGLDVAP